MSTSKYEFEMLSNPKCLNFHHANWKEGDLTGISIKNYSRISFKDSLFGFYPYSEIVFHDTAGQIVDSVFFVEGLEFKCKLGYQKTDEEKTNIDKAFGAKRKYYLEHDYVWSAHEISNIKMAQSVSGDNLFMFISKYFFNDYPQSKVFNHENSTTKKTISQILKTTILPNWGIPQDKIEISDTTGTPYFVQSNINNKNLISKLAEYAYSSNFETSGFYTFINCNGEFYFRTIQDMLNQKEVMKYKIDLDKNMTIDEDYIKDYRIMDGGIPVNFDNYNRKFYKYNSNGIMSSENKDIYKSALVTDTTAKLLIRNQYIPSSPSKSVYAGIIDETNGIELYKGFSNYFYRDTNLAYRMKLQVAFNPNCVSGKTIAVEVKKQTKNDEIAKEFSDKWLICESTHVITNVGIPLTQLIVSKPKISIDKDHPFFNDFK